MNEYLVEIAALADVDKILGNRIAKRTLVTMVTLMNGVPIESVSKMLGHANIRTTQLYAKILDEKVSANMAPIREEFAGDPAVEIEGIAVKNIANIEASERQISEDVKNT